MRLERGAPGLAMRWAEIAVFARGIILGGRGFAGVADTIAMRDEVWTHYLTFNGKITLDFRCDLRQIPDHRNDEDRP